MFLFPDTVILTSMRHWQLAITTESFFFFFARVHFSIDIRQMKIFFCTMMAKRIIMVPSGSMGDESSMVYAVCICVHTVCTTCCMQNQTNKPNNE